MNENLRFKLEEHAMAICLVGSAICFITGAAMQHGARAFTRAYGGIR